MTASRVAWFFSALAFTVPSMLVLFRGDGGLTRRTWVLSLIFAACIAAIVAIFFGEGKS
ncbi:hypothetical protein ACFYXM_23575 [Streptomyces sp. NPDC002476]|uniref:hypothetical protein n=1 Tax=Streptomyces sp. NPDC002476 TaxID=3364648 RepID=UPI0036B649E7